MNPEFPFLAAGAVSIVGGAIGQKQWPTTANRAIIGTVVLTIVASASANTRLAPLVHAFGLLVLLVAFIAAVQTATHTRKKK